MTALINRGVFHYIAVSFLVYVAVYMIYMNFGTSCGFWNTLYFINENALVINLLIGISKIIGDFRLRYFAYIAIGFKIFICVIDSLAYAGINITGRWPETIISAYWILTLTFYIYVSRKRLSE